MAKQIFSTLASDTVYTNWTKTEGLNTPDKGIKIKGGAGIAVRGGAVRNVATPRGARTEVTDEEYGLLMQHQQFRDHMKRGFIVVANAASDPDKVADGMEIDTGSAPKTAADVAADAAKGKKDDDVKPIQAVTNGKK
jgi:hypothetical protein